MADPLHPEPAYPDELPRLVPGLSSWPLFPDERTADGRLAREGVSIVGSQELDRYVTVPNGKLPAIEKILRAIEPGSRQAAEDRLRRAGLQADLGELCDRLRSAGLVLAPDGQPVAADSDLERNFVRLGSVSLRRAAPWFLWAGRNCYRILAGLSVLAVALFLWGAHVHPGLRAAGGGFNRLSLAGFLRRFLVLASSFFLHELAHGVTAARFGKPPKKFEVGFYLGFLPTFFLRVGGLYTLPPRQRIAVWSAGSAGNLLIAAAAALARVYAEGAAAGFFTFVMWLNLMLGIFNLVPFLLTDGYFIASTLLRRPNLRRQAWSSLRRFRAGGARPSPVFWTYVAGSTLVVVVLLANRLLWIIHDFRVNPTYSAVRLGLIVFFTGVVVLRRRRMQGGAAERPLDPLRSPGVQGVP